MVKSSKNIQQTGFVIQFLYLIFIFPIHSSLCLLKDFDWKFNISTSLDACSIFEDSLTLNLSKLVDVSCLRSRNAWIKVNGEPRSWGYLQKGPLYSRTLKLDNRCEPINVELFVRHDSNDDIYWGHSKLNPIDCFCNYTRLEYDDTMGDDKVGVYLAQKKVFQSAKLWNECLSEDKEKHEIKIFNLAGNKISWKLDRAKEVVNLTVDRCKETMYTVSYTFKGGQKRNATVQVPAKTELAWLKKNCKNGTRKYTNSEEITDKLTILIGASVGAGVLVITVILIIFFLWRKRRADRRAEQEQTGTDLNDIYGTYGRGLLCV